jgi:ABC-type spermidine/putrescine transport system permease subunit II
VIRLRDAGVAAVLLGLFVLPVAVLGVYSVAEVWRYPDLAPRGFSLRSWRFLAENAGPVGWSLAGSLAYSLLAAGLSFVLCLAPAKALARREFAGKSLVEGLLLAPALVPSMTFSMGLHYIFLRLGLADTLAGVVLTLTVFAYPYMLRALTAGYQAFPERYAQAARNLGAGRVRTAVRVELPLLLPSALAGGVVVFLVAFSEYFLVFLIGGGSVPSFTGYLFPYLGSSNHGTASMLTLVFLAVPIMLFLVLEFTVRRAYRRMGLG